MNDQNTNDQNTNDQNTNDQNTNETPTSGSGSSRRMTTRTKVGVGATSAALLAFGLMLAGKVDNPVFFTSPEPDPAVVAEIGDTERFEELLRRDADESLTGEPGSDVLSGASSDDLLDDEELQAIIDADALGDDYDGVAGAIIFDDDEAPTGQERFDETAGDPERPVLPGLQSLCSSVVHGDASSDVWLNGKVSNLQDGWIFAEGPTFNGGEPVEIPISDGSFDASLPIVQYGDHALTLFELGWPDAPSPQNLLPTLAEGPGVIFPVGSAEGPIFDEECIEFGQEAPDRIEPSIDAERVTNEFIFGFVGDHITGDVAHLQHTLDPAIRLAYGDDVCTEYIARTAGSLTGATVIAVGTAQPLDMNTPSGPINFPEAIPFTVEFEVADGSTFVNDGHLPIRDGAPHWLTTCGVEAP